MPENELPQIDLEKSFDVKKLLYGLFIMFIIFMQFNNSINQCNNHYQRILNNNTMLEDRIRYNNENLINTPQGLGFDLSQSLNISSDNNTDIGGYS